MDIAKIAEKNPWWGDKEAINREEKVASVRTAPVQFYPSFVIHKKNIYVLRGPRQVGKTTLLKLKIKELLDKGTDPKAVLFYSCDQFKNFDQISDTIETYVGWCRPQGIVPEAIFLDEVTGTAEWARAIKYLKNTDVIKDAAIVVTGSNSVDLKRGAERLPGRGIEGNEYFYYPLPFRLFCQVLGKTLPAPIGPGELLHKDQDASWIQTLYDLSLDAEMQQLFHVYLETGGFLLAINNRKRGIPHTYETYARWIEGDLTYFKKDLRFAKQVLAAVLAKNASQTSINSIGKTTEIASPMTVKEYLSVFEDMQLLLPIYKYDLSKKELNSRKEKKYHFIDPLIYALVSAWTETKPASEEAIIEGTVASHLYRWTYFKRKGIGFYNDGKYEVDAMVKEGDLFIPIEVKWVEKLDSQDWRGLYKLGKGILLNKTQAGFEKGRYLKIPVHVFLALLDIPALIPLRYV